MRTLSRSRSEAAISRSTRVGPVRQTAGAIQLIEAAYGITGDAKAKKLAEAAASKLHSHAGGQKAVEEGAEARFKSLQRSMTNELFKEYQNTGSFDVVQELWKNRHLKDHFEEKNK